MKTASLYIMAIFYIVAGFNHFIRPGFYLKIMPPWLHYHLQIVLVSGILEIILGVLLLFEPTRNFAAWGIFALLIAIFPANIQMMLNFKNTHNHYLWVAILRLPLQLVLIRWAWLFTN